VYFLLTGIYWAVGWLATDLLIRAKCPGIDVLVAPFTVATIVFVNLLPAAPALAGTLEAGYRLGLGAFGAGPTAALAVALASHLIQLLVYAFIWIIAMTQRTASTAPPVDTSARSP
jgi:uncharacterized membrane protein YbhN (UPF0104 family)